MASTIARASLTVTVKEDITLDGIQLGKDTAIVIPDIDQWVSTVMAVPNDATGITLFALWTTIGIGQYDIANFRYLRITVKDDTVGINLYIKDPTAAQGYTVKLAPNTSWIAFDENFVTGITADPPAQSFFPFFSFNATGDGGVSSVEFTIGLSTP